MLRLQKKATRGALGVFASLAVLLGALAACGRGPGGSKRASGSHPAAATETPSVLVITVDTLRPDSLGWIGPTNETPVLDRLAAQGVAFPAAVAPAPLTLPSHTSMFSGLVPRRHGVRDNHQVVGSRPELLAERLAAAGYDTAAVISGFPLSSGFGLDRGFASYSDELTSGEGAWLERPASATAAAARRALAALEPPWFLWVHFYDPHHPYEPPEQFGGPTVRAAYDGEVAYVDQELGAVLEAARHAAIGELLTVVTADHAEALGEHGETTHGFFIYDDTMLVPMIFHWPERLAPAYRQDPVRLVDLAPTLLDLLALPALDNVDGVTLAPILEGNPGEVPPAYLETRQPWNSYGWSPLVAIRTPKWKFIMAPNPELYDLDADPGETTNLIEESSDRSRQLLRLLRLAEQQPEAAAESVGDEETLAQLRALGYLGSSSRVELPALSELRDPKDQVETRELLTQADEAMRRRNFGQAEQLCRRVLAGDPDNRFAQVRLASSLLGRGAISQALDEFARAVELAPDDPEARAGHAQVLAQAGRPAEAVTEWMEVVRMQPRRVGAWSNLGAALGLSGQTQRAVRAYETAAELEPESPDRWIRLGFAAFAADDTEGAARHLARAAGLTSPENFPHAAALGLVLLRLERQAEAESWLMRSRPEEGDFPAAVVALARLRLKQGDRSEARRLLVSGAKVRPEVGLLIEGDPQLVALLKPGIE